jgi:hypothetical protein
MCYWKIRGGKEVFNMPYRSAKSGKYVTKKFAETHKSTTVKESDKKKSK